MNEGVNKILNAILENSENEGLIKIESETAKMNLLSILSAIYKYEGRRVPQYVKTTKLTSEKTMEKYIKLLRKAKLIEFKGASRTGGYYFSKEIIKLLKKS